MNFSILGKMASIFYPQPAIIPPENAKFYTKNVYLSVVFSFTKVFSLKDQ